MTDTPSPQNPSVDIEVKKLELERYKANLDFRRAIIISGFVAVAIALIPPLFQLATAVIDYVKFQYQLEKDAQAFQATYVSNFLDKALNQEIEVRLRLAEYFKHVAQGDNKVKLGWENYHKALNDKRQAAQDEIDKLEVEYAALDKPNLSKQDTVQRERLFEHLSWKRNEVGYVPLGKSASKSISSSSTTEASVIQLDSPVIPAGRRVLAEKIISAFANAGFSPVQQVAALANAIGESGLNPSAAMTTPPEKSFGLFLLNQMGGLGTGFTTEQLTDPDTNIGLVVAAAKKSSRFVTATTLPDAVSAFVTTIVRPANSKDEIVKRLAIAQQLMP